MHAAAARTRSVILATVSSLVAVLALAGGASAAPPPVPAAKAHPPAGVAPVAWTPCNDGFFCGEVSVPLDYDHPSGAQISVAVAKLPATDPSRRIGSLFVNPGGPGGSGVDFVLQEAPGLFTPEVRARFDIVGFDPRGTNRSTPLQCFDTQEQAAAAVSPFPYPTSRAEKVSWIADERAIDRACAQRGGAILNHMSTANVARDLDRLRQAVGDRALTYYGVSYGSFLGNVYANLFPSRFRALVIDGVLDPISWTTGRPGQGRRVPLGTRLKSAVGAQATLHEFFRLCDANPANCAFAPRSAQRYASLYRSLQRHPVSIPIEGGTPLSYDESFLVGDTLSAMYDPTSWPDLADGLVYLESAAAPAAQRLAVSRLRQAAAAAAAAATDYVNYVEAFPGVACSDSVNPTSYRAWSRAARASRARDGYFGPLWTWVTSICADWPGHDRDRYLGPFTHRTARPVLVVGNLYDPATPYQGAVTADRLLPSSRLLTVRGWGHTSLFKSTCADEAIGQYLLTSRPPARGTVCDADVTPFAQPAPSSAARQRQQVANRSTRPHW